jgi:hypothetical protein
MASECTNESLYILLCCMCIMKERLLHTHSQWVYEIETHLYFAQRDPHSPKRSNPTTFSIMCNGNNGNGNSNHYYIHIPKGKDSDAPYVIFLYRWNNNKALLSI